MRVLADANAAAGPPDHDLLGNTPLGHKRFGAHNSLAGTIRWRHQVTRSYPLCGVFMFPCWAVVPSLLGSIEI